MREEVEITLVTWPDHIVIVTVVRQIELDSLLWHEPVLDLSLLDKYFAEPPLGSEMVIDLRAGLDWSLHRCQKQPRPHVAFRSEPFHRRPGRRKSG